ncbi:DUF2508 family protein [Brevibacillus ginsengisoli]|uniref:DUF2508 family protein n=1 Tax=Brevibacillus ginsengisoli TaxID=363854 RepID=UPI003CF70C65
MKWFRSNKTSVVIRNDWNSLTEAIERARLNWQHAQQMMSTAEAKHVDQAIYYLQLTEKRYMFLLDRARAVYAKKHA